MRPQKKTAERSSEKTVENKNVGNGQPCRHEKLWDTPAAANERHRFRAIAGKKNASTFAGRNGDTKAAKGCKCRRWSLSRSVPGQACGRVAGLPDGSSGRHEGDDGQRGNGDGVDTDELNEELKI